jgi:hypothetical protein
MYIQIHTYMDIYACTYIKYVHIYTLDVKKEEEIFPIVDPEVISWVDCIWELNAINMPKEDFLGAKDYSLEPSSKKNTLGNDVVCIQTWQGEYIYIICIYVYRYICICICTYIYIFL